MQQPLSVAAVQRHILSTGPALPEASRPAGACKRLRTPSIVNLGLVFEPPNKQQQRQTQDTPLSSLSVNHTGFARVSSCGSTGSIDAFFRRPRVATNDSLSSTISAMTEIADIRSPMHQTHNTNMLSERLSNVSFDNRLSNMSTGSWGSSADAFEGLTPTNGYRSGSTTLNHVMSNHQQQLQMSLQQQQCPQQQQHIQQMQMQQIQQQMHQRQQQMHLQQQMHFQQQQQQQSQHNKKQLEQQLQQQQRQPPPPPPQQQQQQQPQQQQQQQSQLQQQQQQQQSQAQQQVSTTPGTLEQNETLKKFMFDRQFQSLPEQAKKIVLERLKAQQAADYLLSMKSKSSSDKSKNNNNISSSTTNSSGGDTTNNNTKSMTPRSALNTRPIAATLSLPNGWSRHLDRSRGRLYYHNRLTRTTTWTHPSGIFEALGRKPQQMMEDDDEGASEQRLQSPRSKQRYQ